MTKKATKEICWDVTKPDMDIIGKLADRAVKLAKKF